jgi:predicted SnoaL-like aldol condensation-catalyzing enzyme
MSQQVVDASTAAERANVERVRHLYAAGVNARDAGVATALLGPDFVQHDPLYGVGRDGFARFLSGPLLTAFPDLACSIDLLLAQDDRVLAYVTWRGHHAGTGEEVELATADLYRFAGGRMAEHWDVVEWHEIEPFGFPRPAHEQPVAPPAFAGTETQRTNMGLLLRYIDEVKVQDYSRAHLYICRDFRQNDPMIPPGLDGFKACCEIFLAMAPDIHVVPRHLIAGREHIGALWDWVGNQEVTGAPVTVPTSDVYRLEDGLLVEHWDRVNYSYVKKLFGYHPKQLVTGGR